jgi:hypothetical protein
MRENSLSRFLPGSLHIERVRLGRTATANSEKTARLYRIVDQLIVSRILMRFSASRSYASVQDRPIAGHTHGVPDFTVKNSDTPLSQPPSEPIREQRNRRDTCSNIPVVLRNSYRR